MAIKKKKFKFKMYAMSEKFANDLFAEIKDSWEGEDVSFPELKKEIGLYLEQSKLDHPVLYNAEYYVVTDVDDKPFAITGLFTYDIQDAVGFGTKDKLDLQKHHLVARLGWYAVSKKYQNFGVGGFTLEWTEELAKNKGATLIASETSDWESEARARHKYEKAGYRQGFNVKDYFGPGRDLFTYYCKIDGQEIVPFHPSEEISNNNKEEILNLAKKVYPADRYEELAVCLDLFLIQKKGEPVIWEPHSFVLRKENGELESFCIASDGVYENGFFC